MMQELSTRNRWMTAFILAGLTLVFVLLWNKWPGAPSKTRPPRDCHDLLLSHRGIVLEELVAGSRLEKAGLQPGDVLQRWKRRSAPEGPDLAEGELQMPSDWVGLAIEQSYRGTIELAGERDGKPMTWVVENGFEASPTRPRMHRSVETDYLRGVRLVEAKELGSAIDAWRAMEAGARTCPRLRSWTLQKIAEVAAEAGQWVEAEEAYRAALAANHDPEDRIVLMESTARTFEQHGNFAKAQELYEKTLEPLMESKASRPAPDVDMHLAYNYNYLGGIAANLGDSELAMQRYQQALSTIEHVKPATPAHAGMVNNVGNIALRRGDLALAEAYFNKALSIRNEVSPNSSDVAGSLVSLGLLAMNRGKLELASEYLHRALETRTRMNPESIYVARVLNNLGILSFDQGDLELSEQFHRRSMEIKKKLIPYSLELARSLRDLAVVSQGKGELSSAMEYHRASLEITEELAPGSLETAETLSHMGNVAKELGQLESAAAFYRRALDIQNELAPGTTAEATTLHGLASTYRAMSRLSAAEDMFDRSVRSLEAQIAKLGGSQEGRVSYRSINSDVYLDAIDLQLELRNPAKAFHLLERSRGQSFLATLVERDLAFTEDVPAELERERRRADLEYQRILKRLSRLHPGEDHDELTKLSGQLRIVRDKQEQIRAATQQASPGLAAIRYPQPLTLEGVREILDPGSVMIYYSIGNEGFDVFVVRPEEGLHVRTLHVGQSEVWRKVQEFRDTLASRDTPEAGSPTEAGIPSKAIRRLGQDLYEMLLRPVEEHFRDAERLLLVPDGPLHLVPFAALVRSTGERFEYLIEWKPFCTVLSATVFAELKKRRHADAASSRRGVQFVAFGDADYPTELSYGKRGEIREARLRSALEQNYFDWNRLPSTRREVRMIADLFPADASKLFLSEDATEEHVKNLDALNPRIVHFAGHGYLDDSSPLDSAIVLTIPENLPEDRDNGLLQVWEILEDVRFDADLVVLSGCDTGRGQFRAGEGMIGLTRAFQIAGARSVLASLWSVDDEVTTELMIRFYRHLLSGRSKAEALREAQLELIHGRITIVSGDDPVEKDASSPYYWAGFQLYGDWQG